MPKETGTCLVAHLNEGGDGEASTFLLGFYWVPSHSLGGCVFQSFV